MIMITHAIARYCWRLQFGTSGHSPQCSEKALRTSRLRWGMKKWFMCLRGHISLSWDRQTDRSVNVTFIAVLAAKKDSSSNSGMKFRIIFWRWGIVVDALSRKSQKIQKDCCGNQSSCLESFYVELSGEAESYYAAVIFYDYKHLKWHRLQ